jgi:hypothetical protein
VQDVLGPPIERLSAVGDRLGVFVEQESTVAERRNQPGRLVELHKSRSPAVIESGELVADVGHEPGVDLRQRL